MVDFSKLMKKPAGQAKKPAALVAASYPGVIKSFELKEAPAGKDYEMIVRLHLGVTGWPDGVDEQDKVQDMGDGTSKPIELAKRQLRRDFYDNNLWRLDEFIKTCGVKPAGRSYEEVLPELVGKPVLMEVQQYMNQTTSEIGNQVGNLVGEGS